MHAPYELSVETKFTAAHAITMGGVPETPHSHEWHVTLTVAGSELNAEGFLCDFHELERLLNGITSEWEGLDLNTLEPFDQVSPTAEHVARHIALTLARQMPVGVRVVSVRITEAPGCAAVYRVE
ncbi:MAG TPA: 6-carboxytetrahydropterin synthase [Phycisphaerales bacterium]|nr:6-carboxytetrahydropterin synthase [Phycisphaerales bacterium]